MPDGYAKLIVPMLDLMTLLAWKRNNNKMVTVCQGQSQAKRKPTRGREGAGYQKGENQEGCGGPIKQKKKKQR